MNLSLKEILPVDSESQYSEISANGVHPGTLIYQIGNTGFKPEFSYKKHRDLVCI